MPAKHHMDRFNFLYEPCERGRIFIGGSAIFSMEKMNILYKSVDTVRQLYSMKLRADLFEELESALDEVPSGQVVYHLLGDDWLLKRGGGSGYQYMLQNSEKGFVILVKSRYVSLEAKGSQLKIEVSPHVIFDNTPEQLQSKLDMYASYFALFNEYSYQGCAVHLAVDFQGWVPPGDFASQLTCRSRKITDHSGITKLTLDTDICSVHGAGQSYLFGSAKTIQFAMYDKTKEALHSDKLDYMIDRWSVSESYDCESSYDSEQSVWRAEVRFSHSVIEQFAASNPMVDSQGNSRPSDLRSFVQVVKHLGGLWAYGMNNFRLDYNTRYIHPAWTILTTESGFNQYETGFVYRREHKTPGVGNGKNVALALGNMLSIFARNKLTASRAIEHIKASGLYRDICEYFRSRGLSRDDLFRFVSDGLIRRRLSSKYAW